MSSKNFATRMTCFSLISAIETDLRSVIGGMDTSKEFELPKDVVENAKCRYKSHYNEEFCDDNILENLLEFSDFSDLSKVLSKNKTKQTEFSIEEVSQIVNGLNTLVKARNRVCHSRPLEYNDISELTDFCTSLREAGARQWWGNINEALNNLDNPSFALSLQIPSYWNKTKTSVVNNLPSPEFDDTGFLGRVEERKAIKELIYSHTRVISLIGEGGVGKTALALRCLYDVLESCENSSDSAFEMIIWVTLKANRLTSSGVIQLRDAITNSLGLYQDIGDKLGIDIDNDIEEVLTEIALYMKEFKILLCIDNLETLDKEHVRRFFAEIPDGSKVLITTRIGLGEIEYRYKLDSLDSHSAVDLIRKLSRLLNITALQKKNTASLKDLAKRLHYNPLLIKWYVLSISNGHVQGDILNKQSVSFQEALKFCFQNLYERLNDIELEVIKTITCLRNSVSAVELRFFLSERNEIEVAEALHNLNNSSMLKSEVATSNQNEGIRTYTLTNIANDYLTSVSPVEDIFFAKVRKQSRQLKLHIEKGIVNYNHYHLDISHVHASNKDEKICAVYLQRALTLAKSESTLSEALDLVKKAKEMMPEFSECYRINAYLLSNNPYKAESEYESAIEYNPKSVIALYSYSQFLMKDEEYGLALDQINIALKLNDKDKSIISFKALILMRSGDYNSAIELYECIFPEQSQSPHRKFRLSTYQQAIDCYKRYAERLLNDRDFLEGDKKLRRALELFEGAFSTQNYDDRMLTLFCKLLQEVDKVDAFNSDCSLNCVAINVIEPYIEVFSFHHRIILSNEIRQACERIYSINKEKWLSIASDLSENSDEKDEKMHGEIKDIIFKGDNKMTYGFIIGDNAVEYFFHRGEVNPSGVLDNASEYRGERVAFTSSSEKRGPSAKNVYLI